MAVNKHFVDTSVFRPLIVATKHAQNYYNTQLSGEKYISEYIQMEYVRGFIISCMEFYGLVKLPTMNGYGDAMILWQHQYSSRAAKGVLALAGSIQSNFAGGTLANQFTNDRDFQEKHLAEYIRRLLLKINLFKLIGTDIDLCSKMKISLKYDAKDPNNSFIDFIREFKNKNTRATCGMEKFLKKNSLELTKVVSYVPPTSIKGFDTAKKNLKALLVKPSKVSCMKCSKIGDAIITILSPKNFNLETTDHAFDHYCTALSKPYRKHPSEIKLLSSIK